MCVYMCVHTVLSELCRLWNLGLPGESGIQGSLRLKERRAWGSKQILFQVSAQFRECMQVTASLQSCFPFCERE